MENVPANSFTLLELFSNDVAILSKVLRTDPLSLFVEFFVFACLLAELLFELFLEFVAEGALWEGDVNAMMAGGGLPLLAMKTSALEEMSLTLIEGKVGMLLVGRVGMFSGGMVGELKVEGRLLLTSSSISASGSAKSSESMLDLTPIQ